MRSLLLVVPLVAACAQNPDTSLSIIDGPQQHYYVDDFVLPRTTEQAHSLGSAFGSAGQIDNAVGVGIAALAQEQDILPDSAIRAQLAAGAVTAELDVTLATNGSDATVAGSPIALHYVDSSGAMPSPITGTASATGFASDGLVYGATDVVIPALVDAPASTFYLDAMSVEMARDAAGTGFDVRIQGLADPTAFATAACEGFLAMLATNPAAHPGVITELDGNHDGTVTMAECMTSSAIQTLGAPDVIGADGAAYISIGFGAHVAPTPPKQSPPCIDPDVLCGAGGGGVAGKNGSLP